MCFWEILYSWCFYSSSNMTEYLLLILYFSAFICLCALVCLYFSGCQEMTYKHDGKVLCGVWKVSSKKKVNKHADLDKF